MMVTSRERPLVEDRVFRTEGGQSINNYKTELIRMIVDIWITLGGTKGVSDIKYCKYKDKTYGPQLRFIQPLLREFDVDLDNNSLANRLRRIYGTKLYK